VYRGFWKLKTGGAPAVEPVTNAEVKRHIAYADTDRDADIDAMIEAARTAIEENIGRALITSTWQLKLDEFPGGGADVMLPMPPLQSVTSITYTDVDGNSQTFAAAKYVVDTFAEPARIALAADQTWPSTYGEINVVTVEFVAGFGDASSDVPAPIVSAVKMLAGDLLDNAEAQVMVQLKENPAIARLLEPYRIYAEAV